MASRAHLMITDLDIFSPRPRLPSRRNHFSGRYAIPRLGGLPVSEIMPRATSLQILSRGRYEHQRTRSRSKEWMQAPPAPKAFTLPDSAELGTATR